MKNRVGRPWTQEEIDMIMDNSPSKLSDKVISKIIGRSTNRIASKRHRLLFPDTRTRYNTNYYRRHRRGKINSLTKKLWTPAEIDMITAPDQPSDVELSKLLDRSVQAIQVKRSILRQH